MIDINDIKYWNNKPIKFFNYLQDKDKSSYTKKTMELLECDAIKTYALCKTFISIQPNGFYTMLQQGLPMDNLFWWDFILESDKGWIHVYRTPQVVEAMTNIEIDNFDLNGFFEGNFKKYSKEINLTIEGFEKHTKYLNHYKSYQDCVFHLWNEIKNIDLTYPSSPKKHLLLTAAEKEEYELLKKGFENFRSNSIKFHSLGKSLILNSAFMVESFLNLIIRIGLPPEVKTYKDVVKKHLNSTFQDRLKNMKLYSIILKQDPDINNQAIKDAIDLMTLRNKYVHYDESSIHNQVGVVYFDDNYPVFPSHGKFPGIDYIIAAFHNPSYEKVAKAKETSFKFIEYLLSIIIDEYQEYIKAVINQNPIGYNENKQIYSHISSVVAMSFFADNGDDEPSEEIKKDE